MSTNTALTERFFFCPAAPARQGVWSSFSWRKQMSAKRTRVGSPPARQHTLDVPSMPRDLQQQVYERVDLPGLAASARVSRAWLRAVRENSVLTTLCKLRLW